MTDESKALQPIDERTVDFYGDEIKGVKIALHPEKTFVPVRPLCGYLGVSWQGQSQRLTNDPVLSEETVSIIIDTAGGPQEMLCLPLDMLNGWLFSINANRVKEEVRERLIRYQQECYRVLAEHFQEITPLSPEAAGSVAALQQIRENALAVARLAEEQIRLTERLDRAAVIVGQHDRRITTLEHKLAPPNAITDEQATEIAQKVKALAMLMTEHDPGTNHFQGVFSELHRRFGVSSYKNIRQGRFHEVMNFLDEWAARVAGGS